MSKRSSKKRKPRGKALPALGFAGVSLSMASGACAPTGEASANTPPPTSQSQSHEVFLGEEEISDVSLATFYVFDKENTGRPPLAQELKLARACGGGGGCPCGGGGACRAGGGPCAGGGGPCASGMMRPGGGGPCAGASVMRPGGAWMRPGGPGGAWMHPGGGSCRFCRGGRFFFRGCGCGGCGWGCGGCYNTCWIWTPTWGWVYTCWSDSTPPAQAAPSAEVSRVASAQSTPTAEVARKGNGSIAAKRTK